VKAERSVYQEIAISIEHFPTDAATHETAIRIARRCRHIIQACLREEEWRDADREFYRVCREELAASVQVGKAGLAGEKS
jgi:hypothetical protein